MLLLVSLSFFLISGCSIHESKFLNKAGSLSGVEYEIRNENIKNGFLNFDVDYTNLGNESVNVYLLSLDSDGKELLIQQSIPYASQTGCFPIELEPNTKKTVAYRVPYESTSSVSIKKFFVKSGSEPKLKCSDLLN